MAVLAQDLGEAVLARHSDNITGTAQDTVGVDMIALQVGVHAIRKTTDVVVQKRTRMRNDVHGNIAPIDVNKPQCSDHVRQGDVGGGCSGVAISGCRSDGKTHGYTLYRVLLWKLINQGVC